MKESYIKLPNITVNKLQEVVDYLDENSIEYIEEYKRDEEIDWYAKHLYGLYHQASRLREEHNHYIAIIDKQKEVLDKIKEIIKDRAYWCDETEDGDIVSGKLLQDDDITEIEELLEEIE